MEEIKSEKEKKEEKIVEANIINENEPIDEEQSNNNSNEESKNIEDVKCFINSNDETIDEKNVKNNNSGEFKSKIFFAICFILIGGLLTYGIILTSNGGILHKKIYSENVKTTTLEEMSDLKEGIKNVYESTVYIEVSSNRGAIASGSGFVYKTDDKNGYILTNYHVIEGGSKFVVTFTDGEEVEAKLINGDEYYDIAILSINKDSVKKVATLGDSNSLELGDTVFTVGAPLGKEYMGTITKGIISGINRMVNVELTSGDYLMEVIQTDASINSGNSGGPICNIKGEVVGITSSKLIGSGVEGMGFAIPIDAVNSIIGNIENGENISRPYLGVQVVDITNTFALQYYYGISIGKDVSFGAVLSLVENGEPASKAGLQVGDVIVSMNNEKVDDVSHFKYLLYKYKVGDKITVKYYRNNQLLETTIELTKSISTN